jgi:hypothetical protein
MFFEVDYFFIYFLLTKKAEREWALFFLFYKKMDTNQKPNFSQDESRQSNETIVLDGLTYKHNPNIMTAREWRNLVLAVKKGEIRSHYVLESRMTSIRQKLRTNTFQENNTGSQFLLFDTATGQDAF